MRLRIFDLNTPFFWLTIFYNPKHYGKPTVEAAIWEPHKFQKWWIHVWMWEKLPDERPMQATQPFGVMVRPGDEPLA